MIIDIHGHVVAPPEQYSHQSSLLASRGAHSKKSPKISDEQLIHALFPPRLNKMHVDWLKEVRTDIQFMSPRHVV